MTGSVSVSPSSTGISATLGNILIQAENSSSGISIANGAQITTTGSSANSTITIVTGTIPGSYVGGTTPAGVTLQGAAVTGANVFFGVGVAAGGSDIINIPSAGAVSFNGSGISLGSGVVITAD